MNIVAYSSSFLQFKNLRELSKSRVAFAINRYECFMENETCQKHSAAVNLQKNIEHHQNYWLL